MAMKQLFPTEPKGNFARMLTTLAALVAGIVQARSCQFAESGENAQLNRDHVAQMRGEKLVKVIVT